MSPEQFAAMGTTSSEVRAVAIPLLIFALIFTTLNSALSQLRARTHLDWNATVPRTMYQWMWWMLIIIPVMLGFAGMTGLIPVALLMYWFLGNLWTLAQTAIMWYLLVRKYPLRDVHKEQIHTSRTKVLGEKREEKKSKKATKRSWRRRKLAALAHPSTLSDVRHEIKSEKEAIKAERKEAKSEKKSLKKARDKARSEIRKAKAEERKREKEKEEASNSAEASSDAEEPDQIE